MLKNIDIGFYNAGAVLFGVADYVPALMTYVERYGIYLNFTHTLVAIDGPAHTAAFSKTLPDGSKETVVREFDMIHVVPPQKAPDFVRASPLADADGSMSTRQRYGTKPSRLAWLLKERVLPPRYWEAMLKGREWLAEPEMVR